jgi:hypothetical protein
LAYNAWSTLPIGGEGHRCANAWSTLPIGGEGHRCANILAHRCPLRHYYWRTDAPCGNSISAPMPPAPLLMALRTQKMNKIVRHSHVPSIYKVWKWFLAESSFTNNNDSFTSPIGGQNQKIFKKERTEILAYFHTNRLLTGLYKEETEIHWRKDDGNIKQKTDIDRHGPKPSSKSSQPPDPPPFSLPTTFNIINIL